MKNPFYLIAGLLGLLYTFKSRAEDSTPENPVLSLDALYEKHGVSYGVDPKLLKAIAIVESNENPNAENPADPSAGIMQILCIPDGNGGCSNRLNVQGWPPVSKEQLFDPDYCIKIGAQILKWNIDTYGLAKGIAVYNSWNARLSPDEGPFPNQSYFDKVAAKYRTFGGLV